MANFGDIDETAAVYVISVAAEISGMHPQTLRQYDRLGLVSPGRASGRGRRYSLVDIAALRSKGKVWPHAGLTSGSYTRVIYPDPGLKEQ